MVLEKNTDVDHSVDVRGSRVAHKFTSQPSTLPRTPPNNGFNFSASLRRAEKASLGQPPVDLEAIYCYLEDIPQLRVWNLRISCSAGC